MWFFGKKKKPNEEQKKQENPLKEFMEQSKVEEKVETAYDRIQKTIARNPLSEKYRVPVQQTQMNIHTWPTERFFKTAKSSFVALDLETTGLSDVEDAIIEISAVRVVNGEITARYTQLVDPERDIPKEATEINGINNSMIFGKPRIYEVIPNLLDFIGEDVVAAHNAPFDIRFISQACMRYRFKLHKKYFDTMDLSEYWPQAKNRKLSSLLEAANIENKHQHRAEGDAEAVALLVLATMEKLKNSNIP